MCREFCKPFTKEQMEKSRAITDKAEQLRIDEYNQKYIQQGKIPPLYESHYDIKSNCTTHIYPNGRMEFHFRHVLNYINL